MCTTLDRVLTIDKVLTAVNDCRYVLGRVNVYLLVYMYIHKTLTRYGTFSRKSSAFIHSSL